MSETRKEKLRAKLTKAQTPLSLSAKERELLTEMLAEFEAGKTVQKTLQHKLSATKAQLASAQVDIKNLRQSLDTLYGSTSWKLAAPLRVVKNKLSRKSEARKASPKHIKTDEVAKKSIAPETPSSAPLAITAPAQYVARDERTPPSELPVSLYAFYLPQFHPIAQNDEWWGEGFTEWTNVRPAKPLFEDHYQPHKPDPNGGLGYYDLRETSEVMGKQIKLARQYGVEGFCFYFYWFGGERLLETPLLNLLDDKDLDVPFCLCWANENWSRRWDGRDSEILIAQNNTPKDDIAFIEYISKYLRDPRYRRIDGKPLLIVYRPVELPNPKATAKRWRKWCRQNGVGEIYLAYTQSFENNDPRDYGFDGAIEFPPNNSAPPNITEHVVPLSDDFAGTVYDWDIFPVRSDYYSAPDYPLFRTVCPAWDNTARRKERGTVFARSTPERYQHWLENAITDTQSRIDNKDNRLVFINAWNEWAEGAHLEPDARYGHAYLAATRAALTAPKLPKKNIAIVSHDALHHGAQILALNLAREMSETFNYKVDLITLGGGPLLDRYAQYANLHDLSGKAPDSPESRAVLNALRDKGVTTVICNTAVTGPMARAFKNNGFHVISLIHELSSVIVQYDLQDSVKDIAEAADKIVFPARLVKDAFEDFTGPVDDQTVLCPQGAYKVNRHRSIEEIRRARISLRKQLGLAPHTSILLGVGYADPRKGFDLFLDIAASLEGEKTSAVALWLGHQEPWVAPELQARMDALVNSGLLILPGRVDDTDLYYAGADVFLLTSREDPYPSTVLEALDVGLPVIGFDSVTGSTDLIKEHGGSLVPPFDTEAMKAAAMRSVITTGDKTRVTCFTKFRARPDISFRGYVHDLLKLAEQGATNAKVSAQVSAIVPNYNYAHFLKARIDSISAQTHSVREIILLDDASTDNSRDVIEQICAQADIPTRFIPNAANSGSVFAQWLKGVEAARSEYVWIAEADDLCLPQFLETALSGFSSAEVLLSYTQSSQMNESGAIIDKTYQTYVSDIDPIHWTQDYSRSARDELANGLSVKNSIPNVSGVVFRREPLLRALKKHIQHIKSYRVAGDWAAYVHILADNVNGKVAFNAAPLNLHRRHDGSLTISKFTEVEFDEIKRMQAFVQSAVEVPQPYKDKAAQYLNVLRDQFGLDAMDAAQ